MMNKAAIYARVSTDDQAERGYSLPSQIENCQKFANQKGFDIAGIYQDDISGVKPIAGRPDGGQLQRAIDSGQIKTVIVYRVDRLSRDIVDLLTTVRDWLRAGVAVYALDVGEVTSELDIVLVIKGWQGSDERKKIIERTSSGRNGKAKAGKAVGAGTPPYGYSYKDGELTIDESQAQIVRMIFEWYVNGDENGTLMSLLGIAKRLTQMVIPTPSEAKGWNKKRKKTCTWDMSTVYGIIVSETYKGYLHYGKNIGANGKGGKRPKEDYITVDVPAIVSSETWELAKERRAYNSKIAKRRTKREYLLRGLIYCGCGRHMVGTKSRYYCTRRSNYYELGQCQEPAVIGRITEPVTWDYIIGLIKNPEKFEDKLRQAQAQELENMQPKRKELEHVNALLEQTEQEADDVALAIRKMKKGLVTDKLEQQALEIDRRYQALQERQAKLQRALKFELTNRNIDNLLQFRETVAAGLDNPTFEDKRRWLEILQVTVTVSNRQAVIICRLPIEPFTVNLAELEYPQGQGGKGGPFEFETSQNSPMARRRK